jgi:enamine deaminase RidA (YjgF/YER057c/UK114 family)
MKAIILILLCANYAIASTPEENLKKLGFDLVEVAKPIGNYVHLVRDQNTLYLTGKGPSLPAGGYMKGKLGKDISIEDGQKASRLTILQLLSAVKSEIGNLSRVEKIIKLNAAVNSTESFEDHPKVIDGASNLLTEVFGDKIGKHARTVYGVNSLPMNIPVEIDLVIKVKK